MAISQTQHRILGIDPGSLYMGYAVIVVQGNNVRVEDLGCLDVHRVKDFYERLQSEQKFLKEYIKTYRPESLSVESQFFDKKKNLQSMLKIVRSQSIAIGVALENDMRIYEYTPLKIKMSITHNGHASKQQVSDMLKRFLPLPRDYVVSKYDATDALAAAFCHYLQLQIPQNLRSEGYKDWKSFAQSRGLL